MLEIKKDKVVDLLFVILKIRDEWEGKEDKNRIKKNIKRIGFGKK